MSQKKVERLCQLFSITILILRVKADCNDPTFIQQTGYKSTIILLFFILQFSIFHQLQDYDCILQSGKTFTEAQAIAFGFDAETALGLPMVKYNYNCNPDLVSVGHTVSLGALFGNKIHLYLKSQQQIQDLTISYDFFYSDLPWQINYNELTLTYGTKYITKYPPKNVYTQLAGCLVQKFSFNYEFTGLSSEKFQYFDFQMFSNSNQVFCFQGINNVVVYVNYQCPLNCSSCDSNQNCLTCLDGYYIATNPNTNLAYCKLTCAPQQYATLPDSITQSQTCQNCINNCSLCSADKQCDNCNSNYEFISQIAQCLPTCNSNQYRDSNFQCQNCMTNCLKCTGPSSDSTIIENDQLSIIPGFLSYEVSPILNYSTEYLKIKQIVISSIQSQYPPIYRYYELSIIYSFYVQTCDQNGPFTFMEPLSIQIQSSAMPSLNYSNSTFKDAQIEIVVKPYTIPIGSSLDLNPKLTNLLILIEGGSNQLVNYKSPLLLSVIQPNITNKNKSSDYQPNSKVVLKFQNYHQASNNSNMTCIQQQQTSWSKQGCQVLREKSINCYFCYCEQQHPTTLIDDLESILNNKNLQTAFSSQGFENISNFSDFYKFVVFWFLSSLTFVQFGLYFYGNILDKKYQGGIKFYNTSSRVFPIIQTNQVDEVQIQQYHSITQQTPQLQPVAQQQIPQQIQQINEIDEIQQRNDLKSISSKRSISFAAFEKQKDSLKLVSNQGFKDRKMSQFSNNIIENNELKVENFSAEDSKQQNFDIQKDIGELNLDQQQTNQIQSERKCVSLTNIRQNNIPNKEIPTKITTNISNEKIISHDEENKQDNQKSALDNDQEQQEFQHKKELEQKKQQEDNLVIEKYMSYPTLIRVLAFHDFFSIYFLYDKVLSRSIRFTIYYIRKSLTTAFVQDELRIGFKNFGKFKKYDNSDSPLLLANGEKLDSEEIRFMDEVKFYCVDFAFNYDCIIQSGISFTESQAEAFGFDVNTALGNPIVKHKDDCSPDLVAVGHTLEWGSNKKIHLNLKSQQQIQDLTITYDFFYSDKPSKINYNLLTFSYGTQDISKKPSRHDYTKLIGCDVYKFSINYEFTGLSSEDFLNFNFKMFSDTDELLCFQGVNNVVVYVNYQCPLNCSSCDSNQNCLTCLDNYYVATNPSTNLAYCKLICPPQQYATLPDSITQSQTFDSIIQAANTNMSQSLTINKYILPPNSQINVQFTYMLKINSSGVLNYSTEYIKNKQIVISSIQSEYQPIYRYYELSFDYSFYIQTCDQNGLLIFMEPLSIQIQSSAMPSLNYNNSTFQDAHIQVVVKPYTIQIGSSLDLNVLATLVSNQDISQTNSIQIIPKLVNLLILIEGGSNQLVNYKSPLFQNSHQTNNNSNMTCIQQQQTSWSRQGCQILRENKINGYFCYCEQVFPIIITNQVEKVQNQQYHSVTQQTPQILPQTEYQITQQEQKLNKLDGMLQRNNSKSISSKRSISFTAFEAQKDCLKLASNQGFIDRKMSQFSHNIIENNELKGLNLNNEDCKQQNLDIQKDIEELNLDQQQIDLKQIEKKCVSLSNFRQNDIPNKEIPTKITTNISNEKIISHDEENKQDNQKSALDNDQEQQEFQHKKELEQKKQQEDNLVIEKYMSYPTLIRVLVFHDFFSIYFLYDKVLSRSIRFTIYYIRVIHCLSISTIFGQQYNEAEMIMVSIINSVVLQVSVGIITLTHKIKRIGKYISTFCMIVLCLFYYYLILAVVSGQSAPSSNSKVASFFIMVGIDFAVKSEQNQQQNYFTC
ncbi:hypothetical protein ABPG74_022129 [Tetrahymena malaccensis]